jgi:hypothetical protein
MAVRLHQATGRSGWIDELADLSLACLGTPPRQQEDRLRDFNDLLTFAPDVSLIDGVRPIAADVFDTLLDAEAYETAALSMLDDAVYMISCGRGGYMVTVRLPASEEERTATGDTLLLALLSALSQALLEAAQHGTDLAYFAEPELRTRQLH